jgi:hypothetical protein
MIFKKAGCFPAGNPEKNRSDYVMHAAVSALGSATAEEVLHITSNGHQAFVGRAAFSLLIHRVCAAVPIFYVLPKNM